MKISIKNIFASAICVIIFNAAMAQQDPVTLTGTFTEKIDAELLLFKTVNNKIQKLGEYTINPSNLDFVFVLPADTIINYSFQVKTLKQGHMRLETDKYFTLPLTLKSGQNYSLKITLSKFDAAKKTGFELKTGTKRSSIAFVSGKLVNWKVGNTITIKRVVDGSFETVNSIDVAKEKPFLLPCVVKEEGFYYLSSLRWKLRVYLKPSDNVELAIDGRSGSYEIVNGSEENQLIQKWQQLIFPITNYGYNLSILQRDTFDLNTYQKTYESLESSSVNFRNNINHTGSRFSKLFKMAIDVDKEFAPILFLFNVSAKNTKGFGGTPKNFNDVPAFYQRFIQVNKFNEAALLNIGEARSYMNLYAKLVIASLPADQRKELTQSEKLGLMINSISNDTLRSYFFQDQMSEIAVNNLTE
ncbi:MAG TPA: hypothetical protein VHQ93_03850, partial [Chitinophagaceae bacterium]|nr:hypothetical protein [Chitinophagaceae bacterium]